MRRPGVAVLSASYDPGWTATVNCRPLPTRMVAPALVAVDVPAGTDHVAFQFHGYGDYPPLLALSGLTLAIAAVAPVCARRPRRCRDDKAAPHAAEGGEIIAGDPAVPKALLHNHLDGGDGALVRPFGDVRFGDPGGRGH
jgi:hypothetical protein